MKRALTVLLLLMSLLLVGADAKTKKKKCQAKTPCRENFADCPNEGCSAKNTHDPELNTLKNTTSSDKPIEDSTLTKMIRLEKKAVKDNPLPEKATKKKLTAIFHTREAKSVTAEFTPRVRADGHPNFTSDLQEVLNKTPQGALWVRVTGQMFFDSEHFKKKPLNRATSWEIHPILEMEVCPKEKKCKADSDENWVDLDEMSFP